VIPGRLVFPALRWREETGFDHEDSHIEAALAAGVGGFLVFGGTRDEVRALTTMLRARAGRELLIAADLERGAGQQVQGLSELPPPMALASLGERAVLTGAGVLTAVEALSVGINWALAPVADLDAEPENPIVQTRAFGADPERVAEAVAAWVAGCEQNGVLACAKHFPGHGRTRTDSHDTLPVVSASADLLRGADLLPFRAAVAAGVSTVMTAHVAYPALDPSGAPATFSPLLLRVLREELGFRGLVVSDALVMAGATAGRTPEQAALAAVRAGVDLLLYPPAPDAVIRALSQTAEREVEFARRLEAAERRYQAALRSVNVNQTAWPPTTTPAPSTTALADWLLSQPLARGVPPRLAEPLRFVIVDDDPPGSGPVAFQPAAELWPAAGSRVALVFATPRASRGRVGLAQTSRDRLRAAAETGLDLIVLFGHPRLLAELPHGPPVLVAWHRQPLMQHAVARWLQRSRA
jgi:beta-glucosidase-like glycosyl hydrolase